MKRTASLLTVAFLLGFTFHRFKFFPYTQVKHAATTIEAAFQPEKASASSMIDRQYVTDREHLSFDRRVDSVLLPLRLQGIRISEQFGFPKGAGAITAVDNSIIILDRLGNLYGWRPDGRPVKNLEFPPLPNHVMDYVASSPEARIDDRRFRAYHVAFVPRLCSLAVSHESFDTSLGKSRLSVSLIPIDAKTLKPTGDWKVVFLGDPEPDGPNEQGGGGLAVRDPYELYLGVGDYQTDPYADSPPPQDPHSTFGKIIELDLQTGDHKILSRGHRNPEGLAVLEDGRLDSVEQGPNGGDELNEIREGQNYGWPNVTLGTAYGAYTWKQHSLVGSHAGYTQPAYAWLPSIGVSSLLQVKHFGKVWDGDLLVASLKSQSLFRLRDHTNVEYSEPIFVGQRIRDLAELDNGDIALWTDDAQLVMLTVDAPRLLSDTRHDGHQDDGLQNECLYCHHLGPTNPSDFAPTLTGLFERKIASDDFRYSSGLRTKDGVWTEDKLRAFLSDPGKFAPGQIRCPAASVRNSSRKLSANLNPKIPAGVNDLRQNHELRISGCQSPVRRSLLDTAHSGPGTVLTFSARTPISSLEPCAVSAAGRPAAAS